MSPAKARIAIVGGGAAGAYAALEFARLCPWASVDLFDRGGDPPGAGIVLSRQFVDRLDAVHPGLFALSAGFSARFDRTLIVLRETRLWTGAHGTLALCRRTFQQHLLAAAGAAQGVRVLTRRQVGSPHGYDLVVAADGAGSSLRREHASQFGTTAHEGGTRFVWATTPARIDPMFVLHSCGLGMIVVHAYPHADAESTLVIESDPQTLARHALLHIDGAELESRLSALLAGHLNGAQVALQTPAFRAFTTLRNRRWSTGNLVLVGDAAHTVHFSTGSGTALAMDDAAALAGHLAAAPTIGDGVTAYEQERIAVLEGAYQDAASSERWFELFIRRNEVHGARTAFALRTRRDLNGFDVLRKRDPEFVSAVMAELDPRAGEHTEPVDVPIRLGQAELPGRVVEMSGAHGAGQHASGRRGGQPGLRRYPVAIGQAAGDHGSALVVLRWPGDQQPEAASVGRAVAAERRAGTRAVGVAVFDEPSVGVVAGAAPPPDFLAVPAQQGSTRIERTDLADRVRAASGLPVALCVPQPCQRDDANTLIAAGRVDLLGVITDSTW
jgi:2-polyprenyl-6-methoxyphenol hydroxylase-like FAD-dependent oxidoreductase